MNKAELVEKYHQKVRIAAYQIAKKFSHSIEVDDLVSMGFIGLMDAADKFDPTRGVKFETYAEYRIRGSIFDELRKQDWVPRSARDRAREMERASAEVEFAKGRRATDREVSKKLGLSLQKYQEMKRDIGSLALVNYESVETLTEHEDMALAALTETGQTQDPLTELNRKDVKALIDRLFQSLTEEERLVLSCYYFRGLNLREIGTILTLGESRICQIHTKAIYKLRQQLNSEVASVKNLFLVLLEG
jgi:RNA polymerase sigma factor for flagellar operon FliA